MQTIDSQLELERNMVFKGVETFERTTKEAEEAGRGAETAYAQRLIQEFMLPLIEALTSFVETNRPGKHGKIRTLLKRASPDKAMYLAMQAMFNSFTHEAPLAGLATRIGRMVEDEVRFSRFQELHGDYYDTIKKDFKRKGTKDYRFMHRVLTHKANELADEWIDWTVAERAEVGMKLVDIILTNTDLIEKRQFNQHGKTRTLLVPTDSAKKWIDEHNEFAKFLFPDKMPCIIQPDDWTGLNQGGYYSPELRHATPMIKTSGKRHRQHVQQGDLSNAMFCLNALQEVAWQVNTDVLPVVIACWNANLRIGMPQKDPLTIPPSPVEKGQVLTEAQQAQLTDWKHEAAEIHTQEKERRSKSFQISRIIRIASEYQKYDKFWYVWYADFRGRFYPTTSGFNPQGADVAKGLLRADKKKAIGKTGWYWLRVLGANRFGNDKISYDDRVKWVDDNKEFFVRAANDPMSHTDVWANADKPWQFLAWLFEYRDALALEALGLNIEEFKSHISCGQDGTCNGLQHFSAMVRDEKGGAAVNLVPSALPADIYTLVANVLFEKLKKLTEPIFDLWRGYFDKHGDGKIPRKCPKRPVMTRPYGSTRQSCTKYIFEYVMETDRDHFEGNFKAACELTPHMWTSIDEVVVAAKTAMGWLQKCAGVLGRGNEPLTWKAYDGFPVYQGMRVINSTKIETQLGGRFQLRIGNFTEDIDKNRQRNGVAPNFVHSQDAAHMRAVVRACKEEGISPLAFIHDDFGTHAADTERLNQIIRETFVNIYENHDPLKALAAQYEGTEFVLPELPPYGTLDIQAVKQSAYFFG
ncbi:DNA-directed RNA polymerase [Nitrobacteraceae bacterium UC4449_H16]